MPEMTATKFLKEWGRMCSFYRKENCIGCPLKPKTWMYGCGGLWKKNRIDDNELIAVVQKWSEEHPIKTMLMDFREKHPNAPQTVDGLPTMCPGQLGYGDRNPQVCLSDANDRCSKCWERTIESD